VPSGAAGDVRQHYLAITKWDLVREELIADTLRSVHMGGMPVDPIVASTFCIGTNDAASTGTATSANNVVTTNKPKRPKPPRKNNDLSRQNLQTALSSVNSPAPSSPMASTAITTATTTTAFGAELPIPMEMIDQTHPSAPALPIASASAAELLVAETMAATKRMLQDSTDADHRDPRYKTYAAKRVLAHTTAATELNSRAGSTAPSTTNKLNNVSATPISIRGILRPAPKTKTKTVGGSVHTEDEFGDHEFDSALYTLCDTKGAPTSLSGTAPAGADAFHHISDFLTKVLNINAPVVDLCHTVLRTPWSDHTFGDSVAMCSLYELAYPCACVCEFISHVQYRTRKLIIEHQTSALRNGGTVAAVTVAELTDGTSRIFNQLAEQLAVDMACGTIPGVLQNSIEFRALVRSTSSMMYSAFPVAAATAYSTVTQPINWRPNLPTQHTALEAAQLMEPFAGKSNAPSAVQNPTTRQPTLDMPPPDIIPVSANNVECTAGIMRLWCNIVQQHRGALADATLKTQDWHFAAVDSTQSAVAITTSTYSTGDAVRAIHMAHSAAMLGTVATKCVDGEAQTLVLAPHTAYICDVHHTCNIATRALNTAVRAVGVPIAHITPSGSECTIFLPHRQQPTGDRIGARASDGVVFGTMLALMNGVAEIPHARITSCDTIAPFAFALLCVGEAARQLDADLDERREMETSQTHGVVGLRSVRLRAASWDIHLRAAVGVLADQALSDLQQQPPQDIAEGVKHIPWFGNDMGALQEQYTRNRLGWQRQDMLLHQHDALVMCRETGAFLCALMDHTAMSNVNTSLKHGIVCITRPLRLWAVGRAPLISLVRQLHALAARPGVVLSEQLDIANLSTLARLAEASTSTNLYVRTDKSVDLLHQTALNAALFAAMHTLVTVDAECVKTVMCSLRLAEFSADAWCTHTTSGVDTPAECSCGDGTYGTLPRDGIDLDQATVLPMYDEALDGYITPSQTLLAKALRTRFEGVPAVPPIGCNALLRFMAPSVMHCSDTLSIVDLLMTTRSNNGVPLAFRSCANTYLSATKYLPIADNPMSLARSARLICGGCDRPLWECSPEMRSMDITVYDRALLPKNSPRLDMLIHHSRGLSMLPHAWPESTGHGNIPQITSKATHTYSTTTVRSIVSGSPSGSCLKTLLTTGPRRPAAVDDTTMQCNFPTDPDAFGALLSAESAELERGNPSANSHILHF
jgi:hypothetical protein